MPRSDSVDVWAVAFVRAFARHEPAEVAVWRLRVFNTSLLTEVRSIADQSLISTLLIFYKEGYRNLIFARHLHSLRVLLLREVGPRGLCMPSRPPGKCLRKHKALMRSDATAEPTDIDCSRTQAGEIV